MPCYIFLKPVFFPSFITGPKSGGPILSEFLVSHAGKTTISHYLKNSQMMGFQELVIWLAQEHHLWRLMGVLASLGSSQGAHGSWCLVSHARKTTISHYLKNLQLMHLQELFIWLAQEHYFLRLMGISGGSQELLGLPWRLLVAPGGNLWKPTFYWTKHICFILQGYS